MIARAPYLFLLLILLPDAYLDLHYWRHRLPTSARLLRWIPSAVLVALTLKLTYEPDFLPDPPTLLYIYLLLLGLIAIPKLVYAACSIVGLPFCRLFRTKQNYGNLVGLLATPIIWYILIYGSLVGFQRLEVRHVTLSCPTLPPSFDGYRIVQFSDAHVGTLRGRRQWMLQRAVDSINAQRADMIVFTGDLQNAHPQELYPQLDILSQLRAKDGVYSVLGNHDYAQYINGSDAQKVANCRETVSLERQMGWTLLRNEHREIRRGQSSLVIAGMENDGDGRRFPQKGDIRKALNGIAGNSIENRKSGDRKSYIVMLEHDPSAWRRKILPDGRADLTLSGHTHNMQLSLFGWSPISLVTPESNGLYSEGPQQLYVTAGLGGLIPFRFGATGEIVVITLQ